MKPYPKLTGDYIVKYKKLCTRSNANLSVSVFKRGEKMPEFGTIFTDSTKPEVIKDWLKAKLLQLPFNQLTQNVIIQ